MRNWTIGILIVIGASWGLLSPPGDFNGDGTDDVAIFRPSSGLWAIRGFSRIYYGTWNDEPVPGDYNGDGADEVGIYRATAGLWALRGVSRVYFGSSGDLPIGGSGGSDGDWYRAGNNLCALAAGNIGIGTGAPQYKLHLVGSNPRLLIEASSSNPELNFKTAVGFYDWAVYMDAATSDLRFYEGGDKVTIQSSTGNVGIGIHPPMRKLHVNGLVRLEPLLAPPAAPGEGDLYYDGSMKKLRCYDGSTWHNCW